mgnify:CR=1 FL=1
MVLNNEIIKMNGIFYNEVDDFIGELVTSPLKKEQNLLKKMEDYARSNHVPIMNTTVSNFISILLKIHLPKRVLELGTGIGYSAIFMCDQCSTIESLISYEINSERYKIAKMYCNESLYRKKINLVQKDFRKFFEDSTTAATEKNIFDFIYVDAAKGQYHKILDYYGDQLTPNGLMIFDNVFINGWVINLDYPNHRRKHYVLKMRKFLCFLKEQKYFDFSILPLSDGILLIRKKD